MKTIISFFLDALRKHKKNAFISMVLVLILSFITVFVPFLTRYFLDGVNRSDSKTIYIIVCALIFAIILLLKTIVNTTWYVSLDYFGGKYIASLTTSCQNALEKAYHNDLENFSTNTIKHILYNDILDVFRVIGHHLPTIVGSTIVILMSTILSFYYNIIITYVVLISLVIGMAISFLSRNIISKRASSTNKKLKEMHNVVDEFVESLSSIQTNQTIKYYQKKSTNNIYSFIKTAKQEDKVIYLWSGIIQNYSILFSVILSAILASSLDGSAIINFAFFSILSSIIMSEGQKIELMFHQTIKAKVCFNNVNGVLNIKQKEGDLILSDIEDVSFRNVCFAYNKVDHPVLSNFNMDMHKGDCIRLSGLNGSGKSSIAKIIMRLYQINEGNVFINNFPIEKIDIASLYKNILFVNQDEKLINDYSATYLSESTKVFDDKIVTEYLYKYQLDNKLIIDNGANLSLGQRKKLLFIKMLLSIENASLVIIDEITAGMDINMQKEFAKIINLHSSKKDKIIIIIDHITTSDISYNKTIILGE
ncbi:MAG: ABC transporter ATP-binding protein [Bacilli bacterium]|jgi:ABC-type multidrug transport system fused ATPase/permease subunit|nr:ABC transporter ATP-binding protein [Bacilli bacterium]